MKIVKTLVVPQSDLPRASPSLICRSPIMMGAAANAPLGSARCSSRCCVEAVVLAELFGTREHAVNLPPTPKPRRHHNTQT